MTLLSITRPSALRSFGNRNDYGEFMNGFSNAFDRYVSDCKQQPSVNIIEEPNRFIIQLAAAGYGKNDFSINIVKDILSIAADVRAEEDNSNYILNEFSKCSFKRNFTLGKSIDTSKIDASYTDGVLTVILSKKEEAVEKPPRSISVN
jgi:HSP20 family protein